MGKPTKQRCGLVFGIGQPNASSSEVNQGGAISAATLSNPNAVTGDGTRLYISDRFNHRVLIYLTLPTADGAPADLVLGQANLLSADDGVEQRATDQSAALRSRVGSA